MRKFEWYPINQDKGQAMDFERRESTLTDGSIVNDLIIVNDTPWPAPSELAAREAATALNEVLEAFQLCGSDRQIAQLVNALEQAIGSVLGDK